MDLWALLSITAPGLFPSPQRFTEYYRKPIERDRDAEPAGTSCAAGSGPLMLRRTKEQVAADLPPKQEQVLEVELRPRHRAVYQTHLQRERQKVLGPARRPGHEPVHDLPLAHPAAPGSASTPALVDDAHAGVPVDQARPACSSELTEHRRRGPPGAGVQPVHPLPRPVAAPARRGRASPTPTSTAAPAPRRR